MFAALDELRPTNGEQGRHLEKASDTFRVFCATQTTMIRSLADRVPVFLLTVVLGWSCVLFFGYRLLAGINVLAAVVAALGSAAHRIVHNMAVYAAAKSAVRVISEGLRQEAGDKLRVTVISPGFTKTAFARSINDPALSDQIEQGIQKIAISPDAIAQAITFAVGQPADVDVDEIIVRPTGQS
jgi:NAD(P)-dependent dehydrogenase (short-subunit alcohol dehydrogenase family)